MKPARALALRLLEENRDAIGAGVYRLMCKLVPAYSAVDPQASARNAAGLIKGYEEVLRSGDAAPLFTYVDDMLRMRKAAGFGKGDFAIASHVYLPVMRRAFVAKGPSIEESLAAYDELEGIVLPLVTRWLRSLVDQPDEETAPDARRLVELTVDDAVPEFMRSFAD